MKPWLLQQTSRHDLPGLACLANHGTRGLFRLCDHRLDGPDAQVGLLLLVYEVPIGAGESAEHNRVSPEPGDAVLVQKGPIADLFMTRIWGKVCCVIRSGSF